MLLYFIGSSVFNDEYLPFVFEMMQKLYTLHVVHTSLVSGVGVPAKIVTKKKQKIRKNEISRFIVS